METKTYTRCDECGTINLNSDYCEKCGNLINVTMERQAQAHRKDLERQHKEQDEAKQPGYLEGLRNHKFLPVRLFAKIAWSVWVLVLAIGGILAWITATVAA